MSLFGFSETARDLIYKNLCNISYFFFIYGEIVGKVDLFVALDLIALVVCSCAIVSISQYLLVYCYVVDSTL